MVSFVELQELAKDSYGDMVKGVVDIRQTTIALGGELHADSERLLLDQGSKQEDLWGFNIYIHKSKAERLEYNSLINIRPKQGNLSRDIQNPKIQEQVKTIIDAKVANA